MNNEEFEIYMHIMSIFIIVLILMILLYYIYNKYIFKKKIFIQTIRTNVQYNINNKIISYKDKYVICIEDELGYYKCLSFKPYKNNLFKIYWIPSGYYNNYITIFDDKKQAESILKDIKTCPDKFILFDNIEDFKID